MTIDPTCVGRELPALTRTYDWRDCVLYALSVGAGFDDLQHCHEDGLEVLPTFAVTATFELVERAARFAGASLAGVLHVGQECTFHAPLEPSGVLRTSGHILSVHDKGEGRGALVTAAAEVRDGRERLVLSSRFTLLCRHDGGFGGERGVRPSAPAVVAESEPDARVDASPPTEAPLLYRLLGDVHPLHARPDVARAAGFERPIMHGLCTLGYACRAALASAPAPRPIRALSARFVAPLYPGVPIRTELWHRPDGMSALRTLSLETGRAVLDGGVVEWGPLTRPRPTGLARPRRSA